MSKFLVTGINGCLGAWVARVLLQEGHHVVGADVAQDGHRLGLVIDQELMQASQSRFTKVQIDLCDRTALDTLFDAHEFHAVIHLAALQLPFCKADPVRGLQVNVGATLNLLERARVQPFRLVYASSTAVYGASTGAALDEHDNLAPSSLYGVYKLADEQMARVYAADYGIESAGLRPWVIYGPGRDQGMTADITLALEAAAAGKSFHIRFGGKVWLSHAQDVARAFVSAALGKQPGARVYNLGGDLVSIASVARLIDELTGTSGLVTYADTAVPIATETSDAAFQKDFGSFRYMDVAQGMAQTLHAWRAKAA